MDAVQVIDQHLERYGEAEVPLTRMSMQGMPFLNLAYLVTWVTGCCC